VILALGGARDPALLVLLAAIAAGAVRLLDAVGELALGRCDRLPVVLSSLGLVFVVAAGVARMPLLGLGLIVCAGLELVGEAGGLRSEAVPEAEELADAPVSRAA
jgi:hypothetical protein